MISQSTPLAVEDYLICRFHLLKEIYKIFIEFKAYNDLASKIYTKQTASTSRCCTFSGNQKKNEFSISNQSLKLIDITNLSIQIWMNFVSINYHSCGSTFTASNRFNALENRVRYFQTTSADNESHQILSVSDEVFQRFCIDPTIAEIETFQQHQFLCQCCDRIKIRFQKVCRVDFVGAIVQYMQLQRFQLSELGQTVQNSVEITSIQLL